MQSSSRVLVAEDNPAMARVISFNLEQAGLTVDVARNGVEAWELLEDETYDLVISDYQMPQMDGRQLREKMRGSSKLRFVPMIMLTAKELEIDKTAVRDELGIVDVCQKPFSPTELVSKALEQLKSRPSELTPS